jgi:hypothetical protein
MLKPPFTLLIIKKTHEPVTVQVTIKMILFVVVLFFILSMVSGFGISILLANFHIPFSFTSAVVTRSAQPNSGYARLNSVTAGDSTMTDTSQTDITELSIIHDTDQDLEIVFSLAGVEPYSIVYVWAVVNPDASIPGETVIYPRNPVFRGIPVDYRNGIRHRPSTGSEIKVSLSEEIAGIDVRVFRILVYSPEGKILADKHFTMDRQKRTVPS